MIYYLPERIYAILKDEEDIRTVLDNVDKKFDEYDNFKDYITGYSKIVGKPENREMYLKNDNKIKNLLHQFPNLEKEFLINNGDVSLEDMKTWFNTGMISGIDLENKFYLLSNIINKTEDHNEFVIYMDKYVELYESLDNDEKIGLSKYIPLKYMFANMYMTGLRWREFECETWYNILYDECVRIKNSVAPYVNDSDILNNYWLEAVNACIKCVEHIRESANYNGSDWVLPFYLAISNIPEFQYINYSAGALMLLDTCCTFTCLSNNEQEDVNNMIKTIIRYINNSLKNIKKLLRGLAFYDKTNHNNYAAIIRKYIKITRAIKFEDRIEGLSDVDIEYIMGDEIGEISVASPNRFQERRFVASCDILADAMVRKITGKESIYDDDEEDDRLLHVVRK